ncbi:MAG TPA: glycosyltransferase 87 family protein [Thermoleophilaceae bacterium]|nr:glycosyltransferase 87 family protein [Thermoleophilaceae bacterium]
MAVQPHLTSPALSAPRIPRRALELVAGGIGIAAMAAMVLVALRIVTAATVSAKTLVPSGRHVFPSWMAGPLQGHGSVLGLRQLSTLVIAMGVLYVLVLLCSRWIPAWAAIAGAVLLVALFTLAPPLFSTDIFNYVAYARMGALYHVNPYVHGAAAIAGDPSVPFTGPMWLHTPTAYGPLFTLFSYAFVPLGVAGTMWALKASVGLAALGCAALVWMCAKRLGLRPVPATLFFVLNPLLLVYAVGGGHNDVLMALALLAGALLILDGKPELGGAALVAALAIKITAGVVLPFILVASAQRWRVLAGVAAGVVVVGVLALAGFGPHVFSVLNLLQHHDQFTKPISNVPGYLSYVLDHGKLTPAGHHVLQLVFYAGALALLGVAWWRRDWLPAGAGALLLLVATLGWMLPWYVVWVLPLAPLARRRWVPVGAMALTAVVVAIQIHIYDVHAERQLRLHAHVHQQVGHPGPRPLERGA